MKTFKQFIPALKSLTMAALAAIVSVNASAQSDWPKAKPVTLVVAFCAGCFLGHRGALAHAKVV
jgi:hypothetical protein